MNTMKVLLLGMTIGLSGCSFSQVANGFFPIPKNIRVDQVYWNPVQISTEGCPNLEGTYLITKENYFSWLGSGLPRVVSRRLSSGDFTDVELSVKQGFSHVEFHEKSTEEEGVLIIEFDEYFGCYDGIFVRRHRPSSSSGAETAMCDSVDYAEDHWKINNNGDLVATTIRRSRCWSHRLDPTSKNDKGPHTVIHQRIR